MRRTRDSWLETPPPRQREISSLRIFNGEDLHFHERRKSMMEVQKKWLDEQLKEITLKKKKGKEEEKLFEYQSFQLHQSRERVQDEQKLNKRRMNVSTRDFNKRLDFESREKKMREKKEKVLSEVADLDYFESLRKIGPYFNPLKA